ncbi:MAG: hypothetical protein AAF715_22585 [Myxococcota bacterium]
MTKDAAGTNATTTHYRNDAPRGDDKPGMARRGDASATLFALLLVACGGSDDTSSTTSSASSGAGGQQASAGNGTGGAGASGSGGDATGGGNGAGGEAAGTCTPAQIAACEPFQPARGEEPTSLQLCFLGCNEGDDCARDQCGRQCQRAEHQQSATCFTTEGCVDEAAGQSDIVLCYAARAQCEEMAMGCDTQCEASFTTCLDEG